MIIILKKNFVTRWRALSKK